MSTLFCWDREREPHKRVYLPKLIADEFGVSRSEARRLLATGGVKLDGEPCGLVDLPAPALDRKTLVVGITRSVSLPKDLTT